MRAATPILAILLAGCAGSSAIRDAAAPVPTFRPETFFAGRLHGDGRLKIIFKAAEVTAVESVGHTEADGTIVLDQDVREGSKPPRRREWRLRALGAGRYDGTLTDARGPVSGVVTGNELRVAFTLKSGMHVIQRMYLAPDGRSVRNRLVVSKLGVPVARLDERIDKLS